MKAAPGKPEVDGLLELFAALNIDPLFFQKPVPEDQALTLPAR